MRTLFLNLNRHYLYYGFHYQIISERNSGSYYCLYIAGRTFRKFLVRHFAGCSFVFIERINKADIDSAYYTCNYILAGLIPVGY